MGDVRDDDLEPGALAAYPLRPGQGIRVSPEGAAKIRAMDDRARENAIREAVAAERARCLTVARQMVARAEEACRGGSDTLGLTRDQWLAGAVVAAEIIENPEAPNG